MKSKFAALFVAALIFFTPQIIFADVPVGITTCTLTGNFPPPTSLSVSGTSANVQLSNCGPTVILANITTQEAFYVTGATSSTTATTSSFSLPGNTFVVLNIGSAATYLAAITATGTTTIRITQGMAQ